MEGIEDNKNKRVPDLKSKSHKGRFGKVSYAIEVEEDQNSPKHISPYVNLVHFSYVLHVIYD